MQSGTGRACRRSLCARGARALILGLAALAAAAPRPGARAGGPAAQDAKERYGVLVNSPKAFQGYTLLAPTYDTRTYLIDMQGRVVHTWQSDSTPGSCPYLLENGHLLRGAKVDNPAFTRGGPGGGTPKLTGGGQIVLNCGRVQEFTWDGQVVWDYRGATNEYQPHHDFCKLPNGNVLLIVHEKKTAGQMAAAGCLVPIPVWIDLLREVRPTGKTTGEVVWEWHAWDHLVQDRDKGKANYGDVAAHPELIDVNARGKEDFLTNMMKKKKGLDKLRSLGYVGGGTPDKNAFQDWTHINSVTYNAALDQVMVSVPHYNEVWVIDHGTTTAEAAGHKGGRYGRGGDLLYRWGNPRAYRAGKGKDQQLFFQHDASWIPRGLPGAGHLLVFSNGRERNYSSVDEVVLPVDREGRYERRPGTAYGPAAPVWSYTAPRKSDFLSFIMGGAQRLPNGNTLITASTTATVFEVTPDKEVVWKHVTPPLRGEAGSAPPLDLHLTPEQTRRLEALQERISGRLDKILNAEQKEQLKRMRAGSDDVPLPGRIMLPFLRRSVRLTDEQKGPVFELDREVKGSLRQIFTAEQKNAFVTWLKTFRAHRNNSVGSCFRVYRYGPDHPGLAGRTLTPGRPLEELLAGEGKRP